ncbi:hypothetical protein C8J98_10534 [Luteibacter sp. OK325]|uniref:hypothetical protein n=1 Tax=Luteibacter sp. OK325 TaxID=2135670 RepID=UPI000D34FE15|nr:hypothetical protein [Luteibacter sp. OK325]PTR32481.1 hypothetical protein C8J98_10534 [Luteibacter sp. OK325]
MLLADTVSIVTGAAPAIAAWMSMIQSLGGVLVGGVVTYLVNTRNDRRKDLEETRRLALSVGAEVRAGLHALDLSIKMNEAITSEDRLEFMRYMELPPDYAPITREAAKTVGRFPTPVAEQIAQYLILMANFKQQADAWRRMHADGVLTDKKFSTRIASMTPLMDALRARANELPDTIDRYYKHDVT